MKKPKLKPAIFDGVLINDYIISDTGDLYTIIRNPSRRKDGEQDEKGRYLKKLKPSTTEQGYLYQTIFFPTEAFEYKYSLCRTTGKGKTGRRKAKIHQLVMQTFKPFERFLPKEINKEDYDNTPESMKVFIRQAFVINHIDHDKKNNNATNLEWVTQKANTFKALKHYGGNCANATKTKKEEEV